MTKDEFITWAESHGWEKDRHGHLHKGDKRFKIQKNSVRLERSYRTPDTDYSKGEKRWLRLRSGYFKDLSIVDGKLHGLHRKTPAW